MTDPNIPPPERVVHQTTINTGAERKGGGGGALRPRLPTPAPSRTASATRRSTPSRSRGPMSGVTSVASSIPS